MPKVARKQAAAVGAAILAVGIGAYSAQARDTSASGTSPTSPGRGHGWDHGGPGGRGGDRADNAAALAKALGVSTDKLTAAIKAVRDANAGTTPDKDKAKGELAKTLADALGVDEATITKVLEAQRPAGGPGRGGPNGTTPPTPPITPKGTTPPTPPTGTTPGKDNDGDHRGGPGRHGGPGGFGGRGPGGPGFGGPDNAALITAIAKATGKSEADVKAAFTKLQDARKAEHDAREAAFAKALADKLGLDADKVTKAIESLRPAKPAKPTGTTPTPAPTTP